MNLKQESSDVDKIFFKCPIVIMTSFNRDRLMLKVQNKLQNLHSSKSGDVQA